MKTLLIGNDNDEFEKFSIDKSRHILEASEYS